MSLSTLSIVTAQTPVTVSKIVHTGERNYVEVNGQPYLMYGIQLRLDNYFEVYGNKVAINQYFEKASSAGFRTVIIPVNWFDLEIADNSFKFWYIDSCLVNAKKYNVNIQLIWFGSNVCGWSNVPSYINNDVATYPRISALQWAALNYANPKLIAKEVRAVDTLMKYINNKDLEKKVIMVQVENEPDHKGNSQDGWWAQGQQTAVLKMLDTLGKVIHASNSNMVTRTNLLGGFNDCTLFQNLKGIDIIGADLYDEGLTSYKSRLTELDCSWNLNHTPENGGQYPNGINLASAAFENGSGYLLYELRTTGAKWFTSTYDFGFFAGTLANDWIQRPFYNDMKTFNDMIYKADKKIARCPKGKIAAFNQDNYVTTVTETKTIGQYSVSYKSLNGGEAIAMVDELGDIILMSHNDNSTFTITNLPVGVLVSIGKYDDLNQWQATKSGTITNNTITLMSGEVARVYPKPNLPVITPYTRINGGTWLQNNSVEICSDNSFSFGPQPNDGTWKWSGPNGYTSNVRQIDFSQATVSNSGTYSVTYTNSNGDATSVNFTALVNSLPSVTVSSNSSICIGSSVTINASGGGSYAWSSGQSLNKSLEWHFNVDGDYEGWRVPTANNIIGSNSNGILTLNITGIKPFVHSMWPLNLSPTEYTKIRIRMQNATSGTTAKIYWITDLDSWSDDRSQSFVINANDPNFTEYIIDVSKHAFWKNLITQIRFDLPVNLTSGAVNVDWIKINGDHSFTVSPKTSTTYTVSTTDKNACFSTNTVVVTVNPLPTINAGTDVSICFGKSVTLKATGGTSYVWSNNLTSATITVLPNITTNYIVTGTNISNCSATDTIIVHVNPLPTVSPKVHIDGGSFVSVNSITILTGHSIVLSPLPTVSTGWTWTGPNAFSASERQISFPSIAYNQGGLYEGTYTDGNGCVASLSQMITTQLQQTIHLKQGWNLISTNVDPDTTILGKYLASKISTLFTGLDVQEIKTIDAFWRKYQNTIFNSLDMIESGKGYMVKMNAEGDLTVTGFQTSSGLIPTKIGWNLIGCSFQSSTALSTLFSSLNCKVIKNFDGFWFPIGTLNSILTLDPGKGYFLKK